MRPTTLLCWSLALSAATASLAAAQDRLIRRFGVDQGLRAPLVSALVQDSVGFIWIASAGGLFRYDGVEMRRVSPGMPAGWTSLAVSPAGQVLAVAVEENEGPVLAIARDGGTTPIPGPDGQPLIARAVAFSADGALWAIRAGALWRRSAGGDWRRLPATATGGELPRILRPDGGGSVAVLTDASAWVVAPETRSTRIAALRHGVDLLLLADGRRMAITFGGEIYEIARGRVTRRLYLNARGIALVQRGTTVWASYDRYLVALRPGRAPEVLGPRQDIEGGGPLLVDAEGSLWCGTFTGLFQLPEPETMFWSDRHGLPSAHTRYVGRAAGRVWVSAWQGLGYARATPNGWQVATYQMGWGSSHMLVDAAGRLWVGAVDGAGTLEIRPDGRAREIPGPLPNTFAVADDGTLWLASSAHGLYRLDPVRGLVQAVRPQPFGDAVIDAALEDRTGRLWVTSGPRVCRSPAASLRAGAGAWRCDSIPGVGSVNALAEMPSGAVWAGSPRLGVLRWANDRWERLPGADAWPSRVVLGLVPSTRGGVWVTGQGLIARVEERRDAAEGWRELERVSGWDGLPTAGAESVFEEADGTLWLTTARGVARLPGTARPVSIPPPRMTLVEAVADTIPISDPTGSAALPHGARLELRFAALSFRDPPLLRYQMRLSPDEPWRDVRGPPVFRWVDLPAGHYRTEVRASLDGRTWSPAPATFAFSVAQPWYLRAWGLALIATAVLALAWILYRARLAVVLGLERQRTRIAMDLHDELGSGLGSIGLLSGALAAPGLDASGRDALAARIAQTAEELGGGLADIVWSLDPRASTLQELTAHLAEHGTRLFAGGGTEFTTRFPASWPAAALSLSVRRNILLVGLEALHNAARHAQARNVELRLEPAGGEWELAIVDDGRGLDGGGSNPGTGLGLHSMRQRASDIGAVFEMRPTPGGGTTVSLRFRAASRWSGRLRRHRDIT